MSKSVAYSIIAMPSVKSEPSIIFIGIVMSSIISIRMVKSTMIRRIMMI
jgi:hypothetical protein